MRLAVAVLAGKKKEQP